MVDLNKIIMVLLVLLAISAIAVSVTAKEVKEPIGKPIEKPISFDAKQIAISNSFKINKMIAPTKIVTEPKQGKCEECINFEVSKESKVQITKLYEGNRAITWITTKANYDKITK